MRFLRLVLSQYISHHFLFPALYRINFSKNIYAQFYILHYECNTQAIYGNNSKRMVLASVARTDDGPNSINTRFIRVSPSRVFWSSRLNRNLALN